MIFFLIVKLNSYAHLLIASFKSYMKVYVSFEKVLLFSLHFAFSSISDISLDIAEDRNTGLGRAFEVEQCQCPVGYRGLSCEVNAFYRQTLNHLYSNYHNSGYT